MGASSALEIISAAVAAAGAGTAIYNAANQPKPPGTPNAAKDPNANVYKDRNAANAMVQGGDSTGTGSLLVSSGNVASNSLLGQ